MRAHKRNYSRVTLAVLRCNEVHANMVVPEYHYYVSRLSEWKYIPNIVRRFAHSPCKDGQKFLHSVANHAVSTLNYFQSQADFNFFL